MAGELDPGQEGLDELGDLGGGDAPDDADELDTDAGDDDGQDANPPADTPAPSAEDWARAQKKIARQEERITRLLKAQGKTVRRNAAGAVEEDSDEAAPADDRWKTVAVKNAAAAALSAAGFNGTAKQAARMTRLMDLDGLEPDEDGVFDLEDAVEELAEEYPALFAKNGAGNGTRKPLPRVRTAPTRAGAPTDDPTTRTTKALLKAAGFR